MEVWIGIVVTALGGAAGAMFTRQEKRISSLEVRVDKLTQDHADCLAQKAAVENELAECRRQALEKKTQLKPA